MKGLLVIGAFLAVAVVGFVTFLRFGASSDSDVAALTERSSGQVTASEFKKDYRASPSRGYRVQYRYRAQGQWYTGESWVPESQWTPSRRSVLVCVDPEEPASHTVPTRENAHCGDDSLGRNDRLTAKRSSAPS